VFTGLVEGRARVLALERRGAGARLQLAAPRLARGLPPWRVTRGESIAVAGCCLTVSALGRGGRTSYDLSRETLAKTRLGAIEPGAELNVERALRLGERLGGHFVSGHVDGLGRVVRLSPSGDGGRRLVCAAPGGFERWLPPKGSIAIDGVSLTIVAPRGTRFEVALIPETLARTTLAGLRPGERVHLEIDWIGKWVAQLVGRRGPPGLRRRRTGRS
jgi:riboflavin synthase alpha subunit